MTSNQLTLNELILKLELIKNKELPIFFDETEHTPTSIGSWRGSYSELALSYTSEGTYEGYNSDKIDWQSEDKQYTTYESIPTTLPLNPTCNDLLKLLKEILGKTFVGYKGGDFTMYKGTPIWVANYGQSNGYRKYDETNTDAGDYEGVVDVRELDHKVILITTYLNE